MAYVGEARFRYEGPMALCVRYIRPARALADNLMRTALVNGVSSATRTFRYERGAFVRVSVYAGATPIITINTTKEAAFREKHEPETVLGLPVPPTGLSVFDENDLEKGCFVVRYDRKAVDYWTAQHLLRDQPVHVMLRKHMTPPHFNRDQLSMREGHPTGNASEELCRRGLRMAAAMTHVFRAPDGRVLAVDGGMVAGEFRGDGSQESWDRMRRRTSWRMLADDGSVLFVHTDMRDADPVVDVEGGNSIPYTYNWGFAAAGWPGDFEGSTVEGELRFYISSSPDYYEAIQGKPVVVSVDSLHNMEESSDYRVGDENTVGVIPLDISDSGRKLLVLVVARASWAFAGPVSHMTNTSVAEVAFDPSGPTATGTMLDSTQINISQSSSEQKNIVTYALKVELDENNDIVVSTQQESAEANGEGMHIHIGYRVDLKNLEVVRESPVFAYYEKEEPVVQKIKKTLSTDDLLSASENSVSVSGEIVNPSPSDTFSSEGGVSVTVDTVATCKIELFEGTKKIKEFERLSQTTSHASSISVSVYPTLYKSSMSIMAETQYIVSDLNGEQAVPGGEEFSTSRSFSATNLGSVCYYRDATLLVERPLAAHDLFAQLLQSFQTDCFVCFEGGISYEPVCNKVARFVKYEEDQAALQELCVRGEVVETEDTPISASNSELSGHKLGTAYNSDTGDLVHSTHQSLCFVGPTRETEDGESIYTVNKQADELSSEPFGVMRYEDVLDKKDDGDPT